MKILPRSWMAIWEPESQVFHPANSPPCCYLKLTILQVPSQWFQGSRTGPHVCYGRQGPYSKLCSPKEHIFNTWTSRATTPPAGSEVCGLGPPSDLQVFFQQWGMEGGKSRWVQEGAAPAASVRGSLTPSLPLPSACWRTLPLSFPLTFEWHICLEHESLPWMSRCASHSLQKVILRII